MNNELMRKGLRLVMISTPYFCSPRTVLLKEEGTFNTSPTLLPRKHLHGQAWTILTLAQRELSPMVSVLTSDSAAHKREGKGREATRSATRWGQADQQGAPLSPSGHQGVLPRWLLGNPWVGKCQNNVGSSSSPSTLHRLLVKTWIRDLHF